MSIKVFTKNDKAIIFDPVKMGLYYCSQKNCDSVKKYYKSESNINNIIPRGSDTDDVNLLTINLTNKCNMKCVYCYEKEWGNENIHIDNMTLKDRIFNILTNFRNIKAIKYFGGEPLLYFHTIKYLTEEIKKYDNNYQFSIITNGTLLNREAIDYIIKNNINVTISLDGPADIHNKLRRYLNNKNTFEDIIKNIYIGNKNYKLNYKIECTFTTKHLDCGYSYSDVIKYLSKYTEYPIILNNVINNQCLKLGTDIILDNMKSAIDVFFVNLMKDNVKCSDYYIIPLKAIKMVVRKLSSSHYCAANRNQITLMPDGYLYPCYMFYNIDKMKIANALDEDVAKKYYEFIYKNYLKDKKNDNECTNCWVYPFCSFCLGSKYINADVEKDKQSCEINKTVYEYIFWKWGSMINEIENNGIVRTNLKMLNIIK